MVQVLDTYPCHVQMFLAVRNYAILITVLLNNIIRQLQPLVVIRWYCFEFILTHRHCYYTEITKITLHAGEVSGPCVPVLYSTVVYCTLLYCTILYLTVLCCTVPYCTILYLTVLYLTVLYFTQLYLTVGYWTIRYCTVPYSSEGLPSSHVASLVSLGPCTVHYCTLLYSTVPNVLYYTAVPL